MRDGAEDQRYVSVLTPMRGIAALAVVLFHATIAFGGVRAALDRVDLLTTAVSFFFVLSGFVLTLSWRRASTASGFWWRRVARLLPLYVLAWLATLAGRSWLHWESSQVELGATLLLVQSWLPGDVLPTAVNPPAWSLSCEALFYLALPFVAPRAIRLTARGHRLASAGVFSWLVLGVTLSLVWPLEWWAGYRGAEFAVGVLLAARVRAGWRPGVALRRSAWLSCLTILVLAATGLHAPGPVANLVALPAFVGAIATGATSPGRRAWLDNKLTQAVGRWSYSLYITHWIVVVLMSRFLTSAAWIPVSLAVCVVVSAVLHGCVERPFERRLLSLRELASRRYGNTLRQDQPAHLL